MIEANHKTILVSDDESQYEERLIQGGCSSAQPIRDPPDAMRTTTSAREVTGAIPHPLTKKSKNENDEFNVMPLPQDFYRPDSSLPRTGRDRVPELYEPIIQDERDDWATNMDADNSRGCQDKRTAHANPAWREGAIQ
eukprot:7518403-Pyramimonas_sp.AAC.1